MGATRRRVLGSVLLVLVSGCTAPKSGELFEGLYSWGFEVSVFEPCDRDERWWVVNDHELVQRYQDIVESDYEQVYAQVRGVLSNPGTYGHGGQYPRQLELTAVLDIRERQPDDC